MAAGKLLLISQHGSDGVSDSPKQRIANAVLENFIDPRRMTSAFLDKHAARKLVSELSGHSWRRQVSRRCVARRLGPAPARVWHGPSARELAAVGARAWRRDACEIAHARCSAC
jgi:hypothetical protein